MGLSPLELILAELDIIHIVKADCVLFFIEGPCDPADRLDDHRIIFLWRHKVQPVKTRDVQSFFCETVRSKEEVLFPVPHIFNGLFSCQTSTLALHLPIDHHRLHPKIFRQQIHKILQMFQPIRENQIKMFHIVFQILHNLIISP